MRRGPLCYALLPYGRNRTLVCGSEVDFDRIYSLAIAPAIIDAGMEPVRADLENIIDQEVLEWMACGDYVVADLTSVNPQVFYWLGIRHALKPRVTVLIFAANQPVAFDTSLLRAVPYELDEGNALDESRARDLRNRLSSRFREVRRQVVTHGTVDSPVFQLLNLETPKHGNLRNSLFRERLERASKVSERLANARRNQDSADLDAVADELGDMDEIEEGIIVDLFLSYRALKKWDHMISFFDRMPHSLKKTVLVREQLAFALNRAGQRDRARELLNEVLEETGPSSYTLALLGHVYEDLWVEARKGGDEQLARANLQKAIETYVSGFRVDLRDYYPGIFALVLMEASGDRFPYRDDLLTVVRFATLTRLETKQAHDYNDYNDYSTLLLLEALEDHRRAAEEALVHVLAGVREVWQPEATARNVHIIRQRPGLDRLRDEWLRSLETALLKAASPLGSLLESGGRIVQALRSHKNAFANKQLIGWLAAASSRVRDNVGKEQEFAELLTTSAERLAALAAKSADADKVADVLERYLKQLDSLATQMVASGDRSSRSDRGYRYDLFLSYAFEDKELAEELKNRLEKENLLCFMAGKDIEIGQSWQGELLGALEDSARVLFLLTPRSHKRPWIMLEMGAALAHRKEMIPILVYVSVTDLIDPLRGFQARTIETEKQKVEFVREIANRSLRFDEMPRRGAQER